MSSESQPLRKESIQEDPVYHNFQKASEREGRISKIAFVALSTIGYNSIKSQNVTLSVIGIGGDVLTAFIGCCLFRKICSSSSYVNLSQRDEESCDYMGVTEICCAIMRV